MFTPFTRQWHVKPKQLYLIFFESQDLNAEYKTLNELVIIKQMNADNLFEHKLKNDPNRDQFGTKEK